MHRTLIIGMAYRGTMLAKEFKAHEQFEFRGIADIRPEILAKCGDEFQILPERRYLDYKKALDSGDYDLAVVVIPNHLHYPVATDVLNAGLHCLLEKPFTDNMTHAIELVCLADQRRLVLQIVQNYRFSPLYRFVAKAIRDRRLGRLAGVECSFRRFRPPRSQHERDMAYPMLFLQGTHYLDWLLDILPAPILRIFSCHQHVPWSQWKNPSICHFILQCADGVMVSYRGSYESKGDISSYDGLWRFEFERGDLVIDNDQVIWQVTHEGKNRQPVFRPEPGQKSGDAYLLDTLHEAIANGIEPPTSAKKNLKTLKLLFDVMKAGPG